MVHISVRRSPPAAAVGLVGALALVSSPAVDAQQDATPFDTAVVAFDATTRILSTPDLDGDGDADALGWWGITSASTTIHGFLNDGTGAFAPGFEIRDDNIGAAERAHWALVTGRFDADGRQDFAIRFGTELRVYSSNGGAVPSLILTRGLAASATGQGGAVADFDGDGLDDIALALGSEAVVFLNNGGAFTRSASFPNADELHVGDLDGDGDPDLAIPRAGEIAVAHWHAGALVAGPILAHGLGPADVMVVVGDADADGDDDVIAFEEAGRYVLSRQGAGGVLQMESVAVGGPATGLADVNGDGLLDGVCCGSGGGGLRTQYNTVPSTFHVSINQGGGSFAPAWEIPSLGAVRLAGAVDLDGDGDVDLTAGRVVLYNRDTFVAAPQPLTQAAPEPIYRVADEDDDGDLDLEIRRRSNSSQRLFHNDGTGRFTPGMPELPAPAISGHTYEGPGWRGDFDGDGDLDRVVFEMNGQTFVQLRLLRNWGGGYADAGPAAAPGVSLLTFQPTVGMGPQSITVDVDNDGDLDLIPYWYPFHVGLNDGNGFFTAGPAIWGGYPEGAADFDGDGNVDLVFSANNRLHVHYGNGDGSFGGIGRTVALGVLGYPMVEIIDIDRDGDPDLVGCDNGAWIYYNDPGAFRRFRSWYLQGPRVTTGTYVEPKMFVGDVDGDGIYDLVYGPPLYAVDGCYVARGLGNEQYAPPVLQLGDPRAIADFDGDGDLDLVTNRLIRNVVFDRDDGAREQYGTAGRGTGNAPLVLGSTGPFAVGESVTTHVRGAPGGAVGAWLWSVNRSAIANFPLPGMTHYVEPSLVAFTAVCSGTGGAAGDGALDLTYTVQPFSNGETLCQQFWVLDPAAPSGINHSNGLAITYGPPR